MKPYYDVNIFNHTLESIDKERYLIATYYIEDSLSGEDFLDHFMLVQDMVREGSTGSWMDVEEETSEVRNRLAGKMLGYYEIPAPEGIKKAVVQLGFSVDACDGNIPMTLLSFAGNCFIYPKIIRLLDVYIPEELAKKFKGPKFGIEGTRKLIGVEKRPLTLHIIKPKMGMTASETANQVYQTAIGGVDAVKDDEMCSDVYNCKFEDRIVAVMEALKKAERKTGKKVLYFLSITDEVNKINDRAKKAIKLGANALLLCYSAGLSALRVLAEDPDVNVPVFLHPSHMLAMLKTVSFPVFAKLCRLCGADFMLSPTIWSSTPPVSLEESVRTAHVKTAPFYHIKKTWPMPAAGMYPGLVPILVKEYGTDICVPAGGGMLGHPDGYTAGAKAWRQAIDAVMNDIPLEKAAKGKPELSAAIAQWGIQTRPKTPWLRVSPKYHPKPMPELVKNA